MSEVYARLRDAHARLVRDIHSHPLGDLGHLGVTLVTSGARLAATTAPAWAGNAVAVAAACATRGLEVGDTVITNDPFAGSPHVQDHWVVAGLSGGATVVVQAHLADVGGQSLGNYYPLADEVWQEGVRTTPVKLHRAGKLERDVLELVKLNSRLPLLIEHDLLTLAETALQLAEELDEVAAPAPPVAPHVEPAAVETRLHNCAGEDVTIALRIEPGTRIRFDFAGSSAQVRGFVNATLPTTTSSVAAACGAGLDAIEVTAPAGCVVNCSFAVATSWSPYGTYDAIASLVRRGLGLPEPPERELSRPAVRIDGCRREGCPF